MFRLINNANKRQVGYTIRTVKLDLVIKEVTTHTHTKTQVILAIDKLFIDDIHDK